MKLAMAVLFLGVVTPFLCSADGSDNRKYTSRYTIGPSVQPLVIIGEGWSQQFTFVNVDYFSGGMPTVGTFSFYTRDGQPWKVPLKGRGSIDQVGINLRPGQMLTLETEVFSYPQQLGWAYFDLSRDINQWGIYHAFTVYRNQAQSRPDLMTSIPFVDGLEDEWIIPFDNEGNKYPGIGLVNSSSFQTTTFTLAVLDADGNPIKTITKSVGPRRLAWFSLVDENPDLALKRGQIKVSGGLFSSAVFTLQFAPNGAFTALPVVHTFGMK